MKTEYVQELKSYDGGTEVRIVASNYPNAPARIAISMAERLALVAAIPDGEDSAGRQKLRLPTAEEAATRACDLSAALWSEFGKREWLQTVPAPQIGKRQRTDLITEETET